MDAKTLVDEILSEHEDLDASDGDNARTRVRILHNAQRTVADIRSRSAFDFKVLRPSPEVTLTATGDVDLPATFQAFGLLPGHGSVQVKMAGGQPHRTVYIRQLAEVLALRNRNAPNQYPVICCVNGVNATTKRRVLSCAPVVTADVTLILTFEAITPTLIDQVDPGSGLIDAIPEDYHRTVVFEGVVLRQMKDKGDIRSATEQKGTYEEAIKNMIRAENHMRGQALRLPNYPGANR